MALTREPGDLPASSSFAWPGSVVAIGPNRVTMVWGALAPPCTDWTMVMKQESNDGDRAEHGGRLALAAARFPDAPLPWIDLSTGINPWAWAVPPLPQGVWTRLPEPEAVAALEAVAAQHFGLNDARQCLAVPGSDMAMRLLPDALAPNGSVGIVGPTYGGHAAAWPQSKVRLLCVSDLNADLPPEVDVLVVVSPNNPDGGVVPPSALLKLAEELDRRGGVLILDQAFADADPASEFLHSSRSALPANVVVLRSFGKFFGLAGVRLGFVIGGEKLLAKLRDRLGDWPMSGPAIAVGLAAYADDGWISETRSHLARAAIDLDILLGLAGLIVVDGTSLFRLVRCPGRAHALARHLAVQGILVRAFNWSADLVRLGLPADEAASTRLSAALHSWQTLDLKEIA